jgi:hypothetical protein
MLLVLHTLLPSQKGEFSELAQVESKKHSIDTCTYQPASLPTAPLYPLRVLSLL